jgi:polyvinyl alcohol dehydrogenase (cytochrome)
MPRYTPVVQLMVVLLLLSRTSSATCPPSCPLAGGGNPTQDCHAEFAATTMQLNYPPFNPAKASKKSKSVRCFDGDAGCDLDGVVNNECVFDIDVCLLHDPDPALPACSAADVTAVNVAKTGSDPELLSLQTALSGLVPATTNVCTSGQTLHVALAGPNKKGAFKLASKIVRFTAKTSGGTDRDKLLLTCVPHGWPSHGYNHANHRATLDETTISPANAANLVVQWDTSFSEGTANGVTSTPTVAKGVVYATSWNGKVYALRASNGKVKWSFDTGSGGQLGVQSSATLTADGRVLVGDSRGNVYCLLASNGKLLWTASVSSTDAAGSHVWDSPVVANGRVFVGQASHNDVPCVQGHLYAFDLDTGTELWRYATVPDKVCDNNTSVACTTNADCGAGTCVDGKGAGVTASVAVDPSGETVYMATVGCYTYPSIGSSESFFSFNAATGAVNWQYRTQPPQQFGTPPYHDYGFLNGPLLIQADDGLGGTRPLLVGGSKDGTLYAVDPSTGAPVWTNPLIPPPSFAGFGLFNGAVGFADHTLYAALFDGGGNWPSGNPHLYAFRDRDGATLWSAQIGASWGSMAVANGLLFIGTLTQTQVCSNDATLICAVDGDCSGGATCVSRPFYYVYDASSGTRLTAIEMPDSVSSGASIVDGTVYVGYGIFGATGGVRALGLP